MLSNLNDCKFCVYNCKNGCPSDQSKCWVCKDKSEFIVLPFLENLEFKEFKTISSSLPFGKDYSKVQPLLTIRVDLFNAICSCSEPMVLYPLIRAHSSLTSFINSFIKES